MNNKAQSEGLFKMYAKVSAYFWGGLLLSPIPLINFLSIWLASKGKSKLSQVDVLSLSLPDKKKQMHAWVTIATTFSFWAVVFIVAVQYPLYLYMYLTLR